MAQYLQLDENGNVQGIMSGDVDGPVVPESLRGVPARHLAFDGKMVRKRPAEEIAAIEKEKADRRTEKLGRSRTLRKAKDKSLPMEDRFEALVESLFGGVGA